MAKVIVVGGGIAGLGAAYTLKKHGADVSVLEAESEPGGRMRSQKWRGVWIDIGGESLSSKDEGLLQLVSELGLDSRRQPYYDSELAFEIWRNNRGYEVSYTRPMTLLTSGAFGFMGGLRLAGLLPGYLRQLRYNRFSGSDSYEIWRGSWADHESVEDWLLRANPVFLEYFVEPLFEFMCSYRPHEISKGWFLYNMTAHRNLSLITFDEGLGLVTRTLANKVAVTRGARVNRVVAGRTPVLVEWEQGGRSRQDSVDAVLVAVPGTKVLGLVEGLDRERVRFFEGVRYSPHELPYFALSRDFDELPVLRYYSRKEDLFMNAIGYTGAPTNPDVKFLRASMKTEHILRHLDEDADSDLDAVQRETARYFPDAVAAIEDRFVSRWREALPIFYPGYVRAVERFLKLPPLAGVSFAGDYLASCSTGAAYRTGQRAARELMDRL